MLISRCVHASIGGIRNKSTKQIQNDSTTLTLLHSEMPKLHTILAFPSAKGVN